MHTQMAIIQYQIENIKKIDDVIAVEEPLEIRLCYGPHSQRIQKSVCITMRTPGNDVELAIGFLITEGILQNKNQIERVSHCGPIPKNRKSSNVIKVEIQPDVTIKLDTLERNFYTTSSCGICGKSSLDAIRIQKNRSTNIPDFTVDADILVQLPTRLEAAQPTFQQTGGLHAAGLFNTNGELLAIYEDVGRHNATDKLIGSQLLSNNWPIQPAILLVSGRVSFEILQKAIMADIFFICAIGAPSSLAVDVAKHFGVTLVGFLRKDRFNVYAKSERVGSGRN